MVIENLFFILIIFINQALAIFCAVMYAHEKGRNKDVVNLSKNKKIPKKEEGKTDVDDGTRREKYLEYINSFEVEV